MLINTAVAALVPSLWGSAWAATSSTFSPITSDAHVQWLGPALTKPATRIVLAQGRMISALSMVDPQAPNKLVGWTSDLSAMYATEYARWVKKHPRLERLPIVGRGKLDTLSVEQVLALQPDLFIISQRAAGAPSTYANSHLFQTLNEAGIPVLIVDFFVNPMRNTLPALQALAHVLGNTAHIQPFVDDYKRRLEHISETLAQARPDIPRVFVHAHAGSADCCFSPGKGTFDDFVRHAGGYNLGADFLTTATGQVAREMVLSLQPDMYIATGTDTLHGTGKLLIGPQIDAQTAANGLREVVELSQLDSLQAYKKGRAHAFWHGFNDTPAHIVLIEVLAKWLHPTLFAHLTPATTLKEINERHMQVPLAGTFWTNLPGAAATAATSMPADKAAA